MISLARSLHDMSCVFTSTRHFEFFFEVFDFEFFQILCHHDDEVITY